MDDFDFLIFVMIIMYHNCSIATQWKIFALSSRHRFHSLYIIVKLWIFKKHFSIYPK